MTRDKLVRWCATRERALDAMHELHRHLTDMATLSLTAEPVLSQLADAGDALVTVERKLLTAKVIACQEAA